ncbi:MAG: hypothetical protein HYX52_06455 [Chloroflexi bacterium]|nr:hypothetical protein [Chloroflexota bacterium]
MERTIVDIACGHQVEIETPALTTYDSAAEARRLIDQTVLDYRHGFKKCPTYRPAAAAPSPDPRPLKARRLARSSGQRGKVRDVVTGNPLAYGIASDRSPSILQLANTRECTRPDFRYRTARCKHVLAVLIHVNRPHASSCAASPRRLWCLRDRSNT